MFVCFLIWLQKKLETLISLESNADFVLQFIISMPWISSNYHSLFFRLFPCSLPMTVSSHLLLSSKINQITEMLFVMYILTWLLWNITLAEMTGKLGYMKKVVKQTIIGSSEFEFLYISFVLFYVICCPHLWYQTKIFIQFHAPFLSYSI